jgi:hypothetical protein
MASLRQPQVSVSITRDDIKYFVDGEGRLQVLYDHGRMVNRRPTVARGSTA